MNQPIQVPAGAQAAPQVFRTVEAVEFHDPHRKGSAIVHRVGISGVTEVIEQASRGPGDMWYWQIMFEDGHVERVFSIIRAFYSKPIAVPTIMPVTAPGLVDASGAPMAKAVNG